MSEEVAADGAGVEHDPRHCDDGLALAFGFLGKRWNGVILGTLMHGPAGFAELRRALGRIHDSMLSDRLGELTAAGLVERHVDSGPPLAVIYRLAPRGQALIPALRELSQWAREHPGD